MGNNKPSNIPNRLRNVSAEHPYVAGAIDIYDDALGKPQSQVNQERIQEENTLDGKIATEKQRAEGIESGLEGRLETVEGLAEISVGGGDIQIATGADFDSPDATKRAKAVTVGAMLDGMINSPVFDLSAYTGDSYASLDAALTVMNAAGFPSQLKEGGMTLKFVQSSDNKYVQFRLMAQSFTTDEADWQGVDDEPTAGSRNLVESGGVLIKSNVIHDTSGSSAKFSGYVDVSNIKNGKVIYFYVTSEYKPSSGTFYIYDNNNDRLATLDETTISTVTKAAETIKVRLYIPATTSAGDVTLYMGTDKDLLIQQILDIKNLKEEAYETDSVVKNGVFSGNNVVNQLIKELYVIRTPYTNADELYIRQIVVANNGLWRISFNKVGSTTNNYSFDFDSETNGLIHRTSVDGNFEFYAVLKWGGIKPGIYTFTDQQTVLKNYKNISFSPYIFSYFDKARNTITVKKDGTGDFTSIVDAVNAVVDTSIPNDILIYAGTYDLIEEYFGEEDYTDSSAVGLILPHNVNLIGIGKKDDVILQANFPSTIKYNTSAHFSALNLKGYDNKLQNLTVQCFNCRYPVHDQASNGENSEYTHEYIDVTLIHNGYDNGATGTTAAVSIENNDTSHRWNSCHGLGQGTYGTANIYCKRCEFVCNAVGSTGVPYLTHDGKQELPKGTEIFLECCKLTNTNNSESVTISSLGRNYNNTFTINNCKFVGSNKKIKGKIATSGYNTDFIYTICGNKTDSLVVELPNGYSDNDWTV